MLDLLIAFLLIIFPFPIIALILGFKYKNKKVKIKSLIIIGILCIGSVTAYIIEFNKDYSPEELYEKAVIIYETRNDYRKVQYQYEFVANFLATSYLKKSIELDPDYSEAHIKLAEIYLNKEEYSKVVEQCGLLEPDIRENNIKVLEMEGIAYYKLGKINLTKRNYEQILSKGGESYILDLYVNPIFKLSP